MSQNSSDKKGKILFITLLSQGHINYTIPITKRFLELYGDKAEIHFAVDQEYKDKIEKHLPNAKFNVYEKDKKIDGSNEIVEIMENFGKLWCPDPVESIRKTNPMMLGMFKEETLLYPKITMIVKDVKPDLIIFDHLFALPYAEEQGIAWANLFSAAMNFAASHPKMPPSQSGLPTEYTPENTKKWQEFLGKVYKAGLFNDLKDEVSNFLKEHGCPGLDDEYHFHKVSPYLNIYCYPKELDFQEENDFKLPGNWLRIETPVMKPFPDPFPVPDNLKNLPGKLIYFSLGSMATSYKPLMNKMLEILAQLPHRFIVSTGMIGEHYTLADNMYGEKYLNQFAVLQTVDMVISHGGNNTLTETFNFGKPLIFLPLFGDQPDNAQRMEDKGLGKRLSIFDPPDKLKQDLIDAIDYCSRESVVLKMKKASERIQKDTGLDRVCEELFKFVNKK